MYEQLFDDEVDSEQVFVFQWDTSEQVFEQGDAMTVAFELEFEVCRPGLYALPDQPARTALPPGAPPPGGPGRSGRRPARPAGAACPVSRRETPAQAAPAQGQEYVVKAGDTLSSIALRADPPTPPR